MKRRRRTPLHERIAKILNALPDGDWWTEGGQSGEIVPTLDLYLYIATELGSHIDSYIDRIEGGYLYARAVLNYDGGVILNEAAALIPENAEPETISEIASTAQSRAIVRACRLAWGAHIKAYLSPANARNQLLAVAHSLMRGVERDIRLQIASNILGAPVNSFADLTAAELAELISALVASNELSSQYAEEDQHGRTHQ
jgi:hypothetical protein